MPIQAALTPIATVDSRVSLTFAQQGEQPTAWIEITFPVDAEPEAMLADLAAVGFVEDDMAKRNRCAVRAQEYHPKGHPDTGKYFVDLGYEEIETTLSGPKGTGLFGHWSAAERRAHLAAARCVLRRHGFTSVPTWKKTLTDML